MYTVTTECSFDAAHFLKNYEGKCSNIHGHRWRIVVEIMRESLEMKNKHLKGMVHDFGDIKKAVKELADTFDHGLLYEKESFQPKTLEALKEEGFNLVEVPFRTTAENFAEFFYHKIKEKGFWVKQVQVYETPNNCATYYDFSGKGGR